MKAKSSFFKNILIATILLGGGSSLLADYSNPRAIEPMIMIWNIDDFTKIPLKSSEKTANCKVQNQYAIAVSWGLSDNEADDICLNGTNSGF